MHNIRLDGIDYLKMTIFNKEGLLVIKLRRTRCFVFNMVHGYIKPIVVSDGFVAIPNLQSSAEKRCNVVIVKWQKIITVIVYVYLFV